MRSVVAIRPTQKPGSGSELRNPVSGAPDSARQVEPRGEQDAIERLPRRQIQGLEPEHEVGGEPSWLGALFGRRPKAVAAVMAGAAGLSAFAGVAQAAPAAEVRLAEREAEEGAAGSVAYEPMPEVSLVEETPVETPKSAEPELTIPLENPLTSTSTHAEVYAAVPTLIGASLDKLAEHHPEVSRTFASRLLELTLVTGAEVPWMVLSHEGGHYRVADRLGWEPEVELTGWASGLTRYHFGEGEWSVDRGILAAAAGVNQEELNAEHMYTKWARNGALRYQEAMAYLLAETNQGLYALRSTALGPDAPASDDIAQYVALLNSKGISVTRGQLATINLATDLLSAPVWASLIGQADFLLKGDRMVEIPSFEIGKTEITFPSFHTLLTTEGPVVGGRLLVDPKGELPIQLGFDTRLDGSAVALGAKLYDLPLASKVKLNPYVRVTLHEDGKPGALVGTDLRFDLSKSVSLIGRAEYEARDLLAEPTGSGGGLSAHLKLGIRF